MPRQSTRSITAPPAMTRAPKKGSCAAQNPLPTPIHILACAPKTITASITKTNWNACPTISNRITSIAKSSTIKRSARAKMDTSITTETSKTAASSMPATTLLAVAKAEQISMSSIVTNTSKNTTSQLHRAVTAHALTSAVSLATPSAMEKLVTDAKMTSLRSITAENARIVALSDVINMATDVKTSASQIPAQTKNRAAQRANSNPHTT